LAQEIPDPSIMGVAMINLAEATSQMGDLAGGVKLAEHALREAEGMGEMEYVVDFLPSLAELYVRAGRLPEALLAMQRRVAEGDKLFQRSQTNALAEMQAQFDAAQREQEILLLKRENDIKSASLATRQLQQRLAWLVGGVLLLAGLGLFEAYRRVRRTHKALALSHSELAFKSDHDALTGLFNRRSLQVYLQLSEHIARPNEAARPAMAFVLADIDHFKQINDRHGHAAGDAVLVELALRFARLVRPGDRLFRWGGEEFLLLLQQWPEGALPDLCQRILGAVADEPFLIDGQPVWLTLSLGACPYPLRREPVLANDWGRHLRWADMALYLSKARGRKQGHAIVALSDASDDSLQRVDRDLTAAAADGLVHLETVQFQSSRPPGARAEITQDTP
jgi:diguanylate cyclase (GGDEF)-like protein